MSKPKILIFDVETAPMLAYCWGLYDQNFAPGQIKVDWYLLSYAAKWYGEKEVFQKDQRKANNIEDDSQLLKGIWKLLDEADIVVGQNSRAFDTKKLNARFIVNGMKPPSPYKQVDTKQIAKNKFGFVSNGLEYLSAKLCKAYKKSDHKKYPGFALWRECINGNKEAWDEMAKYNILDVLATEELYTKFQPWDNSINPNHYSDEGSLTACSCGATSFEKRGFAYTATQKFQRYCCKVCGAFSRGRKNLFSKGKKSALRVKL